MKRMVNTTGFFEYIFDNAKENSVIIMDTSGKILEVNQGFIECFGYSLKELKGKHLRVLFTPKDRKQKMPQIEIATALANGAKSDNNYLVKKGGDLTWVMGESIKVENKSGEVFIVKVIQNIDAQKQLERFLLSSNDFIDTIFDSIKNTALLILDAELKIIKSNKEFVRIFELKEKPEHGMRLSKVENGFWRKQDIRNKLMDIIVHKKNMSNEKFIFDTTKGQQREVIIDSKIINNDAMEKQVLLVIRKNN